MIFQSIRKLSSLLIERNKFKHKDSETIHMLHNNASEHFIKNILICC